jgi:hypothetical protein
MKRPYIPWGCDQQGRIKLTEAHLDRRIAEKLETRGMADLLLSSGAIEGPYRHTHPVTRWSLALRRFHRALLAVLAPRNTKGRT